MHRLVRLLAPFALVGLLGCPLDIEVRQDTDAEPRACVKDQECPDGQRCGDDDSDNHCVPGPRVTQPCSGGYGTCSYAASCQKGLCTEDCVGGPCRLGYQCAPDYKCVEACTEGPPTKLGDFCETSTDCGRCGFCVDSGSKEKRCHQPCSSDAECPGATPGVCEKVQLSSLRVCHLP